MFMTEPIKDITKEIVDMGGKKVGDESFRDKVFGEIQELLDTTPEELTRDDLMEVSASEPMQTMMKTKT